MLSDLLHRLFPSLRPTPQESPKIDTDPGVEIEVEWHCQDNDREILPGLTVGDLRRDLIFCDVRHTPRKP